MLKRWKKWFVALAAVLLVLTAIGFVLPPRQTVVRRIVTTAPPARWFPPLATLRRWPEWTAWNTNRFPDLTMRFEGPDTGTGATLIAAGKSSGDGTVKITSADPAAGLTYTLDFQHGTQLFNGAIRFTNAADGWLVTWTLDAELGRNPVKRWAGLALGALMGGDMEKGLANLKRELETSR